MVLAIFVPGRDPQDAGPGLARALARRAAVEATLGPILQAVGGRVVCRQGDTVLAAFRAPEGAPRALLAVLDGQRALGSGDSAAAAVHAHARMALGLGPTLVLPEGELYGPEVDRARLLAERSCREGELLLTEAMAGALRPLPVGVGLHGAPAARIDQAGFAFRLARDHRD